MVSPPPILSSILAELSATAMLSSVLGTTTKLFLIPKSLSGWLGLLDRWIFSAKFKFKSLHFQSLIFIKHMFPRYYCPWRTTSTKFHSKIFPLLFMKTIDTLAFASNYPWPSGSLITMKVAQTWSGVVWATRKSRYFNI